MQRYVLEQGGNWETHFPFLLTYTGEKMVFSEDLPEVLLEVTLHSNQGTEIILPLLLEARGLYPHIFSAFTFNHSSLMHSTSATLAFLLSLFLPSEFAL